ncbi:hypothetical protein [Brevibacterium oceani]|uniref:hypothetical protein n=1 Tax=Brevibacterium oceani TaxID=358099 RepID=UPI001B31E349|nr:hypothetical protein [Brevibacterium oceani]
MEITGQPNLGPMRVDLGRLHASDLQPVIAVMYAFTSLLCVVAIGLGFVVMTFFAGLIDGGSRALVVAFGVVIVVAGVLGLAALVLVFVRSLKVSLRIHDEGIECDQLWSRRTRVFWSQIAAIIPPSAGDARRICALRLRDGRRVVIHRLALPSHRDSLGQVLPHHDVRVVIDHFMHWRRIHGLIPGPTGSAPPINRP